MFRDFEPHIEELRRRILGSFLAFLAATAICFFFSPTLIDWLTQPLKAFSDSTALYFQKPYDAFLIHLKVSTAGGLILSSPILISQAWLFLAPGLYEREKKMIVPLSLITSGLFLFGTWFCYAWVIPWGLRFLLSYQTEMIQPLIGVGPYFSFLISMLFIFGLLFDFPVLLVGLVKVGVLETSTLRQMRKTVVLGIFVVAAALTPSPDPVSQILLALPLWVLFEISVSISTLVEPKNRFILVKKKRPFFSGNKNRNH